MNLSVNLLNLVQQLLPPHKRQPIRLTLLRSFLQPLETLFDNFDLWRDNTRMMVNVNCQVKVFEGYLRKKYNEPIAIKIITFDDGLLTIGREEEGLAMMKPIGLDDENQFAEIALDGELRIQFGNADFMVYIPTGLDINLIMAEIEKYKQALTRYKIIQN